MCSADTPDERLKRLLQRLRSLRLMRLPPDSELTPSQLAMLSWVARYPGSGVLEIAQGLDITPPTVSVGVQRLVDESWLERRQDPDDKRAKPLYLTEDAEAFMQQIRSHHGEMMRMFLSGLTSEEQEQFLTLFERAVSGMEAAAGKDS